MVRFLLLCHVLIGFALFGRSAAIGDEPTPVAIMDVRGRSAGDLAKVAADVLEGEKVKVTVDSTANLLIVKGAEDDVKRVSRLLQTLDPLPRTVSLQVDISVTDPEDSGRVVAQDQLMLSMLDQTKGFVQAGQQTDVVTGTQSFGSRGKVNQTQMISTGTLLKAVPRVSESGIIVELELEKSWLEFPKADGGDDDSARGGKYSNYTCQVQTTLRLEPGKPAEISAIVSGGKGKRQAVISISATLDAKPRSAKLAEPKKAAPKRSPTAVRGKSEGSKRPETPERTAPRSSRPNPQALFDRLDADGDGEISTEEREGVMGRFLERLGFAADDEITTEAIGDKMRQLQEERATQPEK